MTGMKPFGVLVLLLLVSAPVRAGTSAPVCPPGKPLLSFKGRCHSCDDPGVIRLIEESECALACDGSPGRPKREADFDGCRLSDCPEDRPLRAKNGECLTCDHEPALFYPTKYSEARPCASCDGKDGRAKRVQRGDYCLALDCDGKPLRDLYGACYACDTPRNVQTFADQCRSSCPNRRVSGTWTNKTGGREEKGIFCIPPDKTPDDCPADKPLLDQVGECRRCDDPASIRSVGMNCVKSCPGRKIGGWWNRHGKAGIKCELKRK